MCVDAMIDGRITAVFSQQTFAELDDVLSRERLERFFSKAGVDTRHFLTDLRQIAEFVTPGQNRLFIRDPKDEPFRDRPNCFTHAK